ncbi:type VII secretion-associated protein [Rhodococcus sp. NPDC058521]|uniref:type VII secretion-associated protein n=1 Tax=Rhodococcus sp. NPDC058521 TaxID=3346536 RepID=UPI00366100F4
MTALHLAENGVWCSHQSKTWKASSAVLGGLDGSMRVVSSGEASVAPLQYMDDDHVLVGDRPVSLHSLLLLVIGKALESASDNQPADLVKFTYPSEWGAARVGRVSAALREMGIAPEGVATSIEVVAHRRGIESVPDRSPRVVIEPGADSVTVTRVEPSSLTSGPKMLALSACEFVSPGEVADAVESVVGDGSIREVVVTAGMDESRFSLFRDAIVERLGPVDVVLVHESDIVSALDTDDSVPQDCSRQAGTVLEMRSRKADWLGDAARSERLSGRSWVPVAAGSAVAAVLVVAVGFWTWNGLSRSNGVDTAALNPPVSATADPTPSVTVSPNPHSVGGLQFDLPAGWVEREPSRVDSGENTRLELVPIEHLPLRIVVVENRLRHGTGFDEVAQVLAQKAAAKPKSFVDFDPSSEFAGRSGASYSELPDGGSEVRWFVVVDAGIQISVGCQAAPDDRDDLHEACQSVVRSVGART